MLTPWTEFDRFFDTLHRDTLRGRSPRSAPRATFATGTFPPVDVLDSAESLQLVVDLPGLAREEVSITVEEGDVLTISGERTLTPAEGVQVLRRERSSAKFARRFKLGADLDPSGTAAEFTNGVLTITVPKAPEKKPLQIEVK